jgi:hypothetical protein
MTLNDLINSLEAERERFGGGIPVFAGQADGGTNTRLVERVDCADRSGITIRFSVE